MEPKAAFISPSKGRKIKIVKKPLLRFCCLFFGYAKQGQDGADLECEVVSKLWGVRSGCG